jgi:hypothetical protein
MSLAQAGPIGCELIFGEALALQGGAVYAVVVFIICVSHVCDSRIVTSDVWYRLHPDILFCADTLVRISLNTELYLGTCAFRTFTCVTRMFCSVTLGSCTM